eukprot:UN3706
MTALALDQVRRARGVVLAICTETYGEVTSSPYSSHEELKFADAHRLDVIPLKVDTKFPPEPPFGSQHPFDKLGVGQAFVNKVLKPNVARIDCCGQPDSTIAALIAKALQKRRR